MEPPLWASVGIHQAYQVISWAIPADIHLACLAASWAIIAGIHLPCQAIFLAIPPISSLLV